MTNSAITRTSTPGDPETPLEWIAGAGAFAVEIALAITWGIVGYRLSSRIAGPVTGWIGAVVAVAALVGMWSTWMSPNADHRFDVGGRLIASSILIIIAAVGAFSTGSTSWALILGIGGIALTVAAELLIG